MIFLNRKVMYNRRTDCISDEKTKNRQLNLYGLVVFAVFIEIIFF